MKREKCVFLQSEVEYVGYHIDEKGIHTSPAKLEAIQQAPTPTNTTELRSLLEQFCYTVILMAQRSRAAPILVSVLVSGRYCCFHEVSESAIILLQILILITCENKITFVCTCLFY